ncbi:hypothetical protein RND71_043659 [Anisodus tanguticus]|uniref:HMG box domain-containing protein n=1 Tax=Anisodus tanguticus TaxID=243964 RepID=A0AAE1UMZ9_9SOLA|nr:hypothetical protein RND71_043659 [Anisodus tanguticus]
MSEKEKQRFKTLAEKDKKRYDNDMKNYSGPTGKPSKKKKKDPNAPKRALSAFFWFCNDERSVVKSTQPDASVGEVAKELGKRWGVIKPELKKKYEALATKDKARYEKEMIAYKKKSAPTKGSSSKKQPQPQEASEESEEDEDEEEDDE